MRGSGSGKNLEIPRPQFSQQQPIFKANSLKHKDDVRKANRKIGNAGSSVSSLNVQKPASQKNISTYSTKQLVTPSQTSLMYTLPTNVSVANSTKILRNSNLTTSSIRKSNTESNSLPRSSNDGLEKADYLTYVSTDFKNSKKILQPQNKPYRPIVDESIIESRGKSVGHTSSITSRDHSRIGERASNTSGAFSSMIVIEKQNGECQTQASYLQRVDTQQQEVTNVYSIGTEGFKGSSVNLGLLTNRTTKAKLSFDRQPIVRTGLDHSRRPDQKMSDLIQVNGHLRQEIENLSNLLKSQREELDQIKKSESLKDIQIEHQGAELFRMKGENQKLDLALRTTAEENNKLKEELQLIKPGFNVRHNETGSSSQSQTQLQMTINQQESKEIEHLKKQLGMLKEDLESKNSMILSLNRRLETLSKEKEVAINQTIYQKADLANLKDQPIDGDDRLVKQRFIIESLLEKISSEEKRATNFDKDFLNLPQVKINERIIVELTQFLENKQRWMNERMAKEGGCSKADMKSGNFSRKSQSSSISSSLMNLPEHPEMAASQEYFNFKKCKGKADKESIEAIAGVDGDTNAKIEWYRQMKKNTKTKEIDEFKSNLDPDEVLIEHQNIDQSNPSKSAGTSISDFESRRNSIAQSEESSLSKILKQYK